VVAIAFVAGSSLTDVVATVVTRLRYSTDSDCGTAGPAAERSNRVLMSSRNRPYGLMFDQKSGVRARRSSSPIRSWNCETSKTACSRRVLM
jgi:hypothetical protein